MSISVEQAYAQCRAIAKREAKNFYYSFVALPPHKSNAMCAVYAFMRKADDLADDESLSIPERRQRMAVWLEDWRRARAGAPTDDAVFVALKDAQRRFQIPDDLLEKLVQGTTLDIQETKPGVRILEIDGRPYEVYESISALYDYCYLVASVVGLVCIRIFGYHGTEAVKLAEETGLAFQVTNILRDVKEDSERGRVYLPLDELQAAGLTPADVLQGDPVLLRPVMLSLAAKAKAMYLASDRLTPMLDRDSRAAMWVLAKIYRMLLERIERMDFDVFSERVSVPTATKLRVLGQGMAMTLWNRVAAR
ncbi:phytoene/squalene synthase family protein [Terriglobus albidus]|uniref:phytoene/squalene synthase family protein n=1 Tax=Terriglobus albidus TaxID=1592106 RepID=UPI0021DFD2B4|nr:phytoene/squalene synthase family protein [Terriglobus albidus]